MKMEIMDMPCLSVRDLLVGGVQLDQAYLARPSHRERHGLPSDGGAQREGAIWEPFWRACEARLLRWSEVQQQVRRQRALLRSVEGDRADRRLTDQEGTNCCWRGCRVG